MVGVGLGAADAVADADADASGDTSADACGDATADSSGDASADEIACGEADSDVLGEAFGAVTFAVGEGSADADAALLCDAELQPAAPAITNAKKHAEKRCNMGWYTTACGLASFLMTPAA